MVEHTNDESHTAGAAKQCGCFLWSVLLAKWPVFCLCVHAHCGRFTRTHLSLHQAQRFEPVWMWHSDWYFYSLLSSPDWFVVSKYRHSPVFFCVVLLKHTVTHKNAIDHLAKAFLTLSLTAQVLRRSTCTGAICSLV